MKDEELVAILIAGGKAFQYAHDHLRDEMEDVARFDATYSALIGEQSQTTHCINT